MSDDYLFDGTGPVDLEVARLERTLAPLRHRPPAPRAARALGAVALAAVVLGALGLGMWWATTPAPWSVTTASCVGCTWEVGAALDTTTDATARLDHRGRVQAHAGARLRRLPVDTGAHLALDVGDIDVELVAPPRWLVVELPGVRLVDLGCAFRAVVEPSGHGRVAVRSGWVALEGRGPVTQLPAGSVAATWPDGHTGLPVVQGASPALVEAVDALDRGEGGAAAVLARASRPEDALTVWHLLERVDEADRPAVWQALEALVPGEIPGRAGSLSLDDEGLSTSLAYVVAATM